MSGKNKKFISPADFWLMLRCALTTAYYGGLLIFPTWFGKQLKREYSDNILKSWARKLLGIVKAQVTVKPSSPIQYQPNQTYILMSNHASLYDIPIIIGSLPGNIRMLGKVELKKIPFLGKGMELSECIFIDRQNRRQAMLDLAAAKAAMLSGIVLWTAPEGTRTRTGELLEFKMGVFKLALTCKAIIIPVGISGSRAILPAGKFHFSTRQNVTVNVGAPIDTNGYQGREKELCDTVRDEIARLLS